MFKEEEEEVVITHITPRPLPARGSLSPLPAHFPPTPLYNPLARAGLIATVEEEEEEGLDGQDQAPPPASRIQWAEKGRYDAVLHILRASEAAGKSMTADSLLEAVKLNPAFRE